jgi:hypothetical protein
MEYVGILVWPFGIFWGHLVYFMDIWYIFPDFGMLYQEKSGSPGCMVVRAELANAILEVMHRKASFAQMKE